MQAGGSRSGKGAVKGVGTTHVDVINDNNNFTEPISIMLNSEHVRAAKVISGELIKRDRKQLRQLSSVYLLSHPAPAILPIALSGAISSSPVLGP